MSPTRPLPLNFVLTRSLPLTQPFGLPVYLARSHRLGSSSRDADRISSIVLRQGYGGTGNCAKKSHGVSGKPDDDDGFAALAQLESPRKKRASPHAVSSFYADGVFYVYLLHSTKDNGFYIGYSTDLKRRLSQHTRGASFATKSRGPWKLIYYEAYTEREDAEGREKFLKSGAGRRFLRAQLRHYLKRFPTLTAQDADYDVPTPH